MPEHYRNINNRLMMRRLVEIYQPFFIYKTNRICYIISMSKYIIVNPRNGKAVQSYSFAERKHIMYCNDPEWAMKFEDEDTANKKMEYLTANFPGQTLTVMRITFNKTFTIG